MKSPIHLPLTDSAVPLADAASGADEISTFAFRRTGPGRDRPGVWLHCAAGGLCVLAAAAAAVSFTAQYRLVYAARRLALIAAWRPRSPMPPRWCSPAWGWRWRCTAATRSGPGC